MSVIQKILSKPIEHLIMKKKKLPNREVISLYRQVYKFAGKFYWNNQKGQSWKNLLRRSARKQFDLSKQEKDPFLVMKMMITTRQCMKQMDSKICQTQSRFVKTVDQTRNQDPYKSKKQVIYK